MRVSGVEVIGEEVIGVEVIGVEASNPQQGVGGSRKSDNMIKTKSSKGDPA